MFDIFKKSDKPTRNAFLLRGFMKSGTNWVGNLLDSHPHVSVIGEFHWQDLLKPLLKNFGHHPVFEDSKFQEFTRAQFESMVHSCLDNLAKPGAIVVGERTPQRIEPFSLRNVPVISVVRDGRDVLVSRAFHLHNYPTFHRLFEREPEIQKIHEGFKADPWFFKKNPEQLLSHHRLVWESVRYWNDHLVADRETVERHPDLKVRFVQYEDLHRDTEGVRRQLFEFLNVDPERANPVKGFISAGFEEEQPTEFYRKGVVGDWKNYFNDEVKMWFKEEGGDELIRQGYESSHDW